MSPEIQARLNAALAKPYTHNVITVCSDGREIAHPTRSLAEAQNNAKAESRWIGRTYLRREDDQPYQIVAVRIEAIQ